MLVDGDVLQSICYQVFVLLKIFVRSVSLQQNSWWDWTTPNAIRTGCRPLNSSVIGIGEIVPCQASGSGKVS